MTSPTRDPVLEHWLPLTEGMILVRGPVEVVAEALRRDDERLRWRRDYAWEEVPSLEALYRGIERLTEPTTRYFVLPTRTPWSVIQSDSLGADPGFSLGYCLAYFQGLEALVFTSNDRTMRQLAGTQFRWVKPGSGHGPAERSVYCCSQGSRWHFHATGEPLPEEDLARYASRKVRQRLDEAGLAELLGGLGCHPWREATYALPGKVFVVTNPAALAAPAHARPFAEVRAEALESATRLPARKSARQSGPPDYLRGIAVKPSWKGPARLLKDGAWCGHGETRFRVYEVRLGEADRLRVRRTGSSGPALVEIESPDTGERRPIYDARRHPASPFVGSSQAPGPLSAELCPKCGGREFRVAIGFELPADSESANDTSWFALAIECAGCSEARLAFEDETA